MEESGKFPTIRSGVLFGQMGTVERAVYFDALASADVTDVDPRAYYGTNGWLRATAGMDREKAEDAFRGQIAALTPGQRRDAAYGNALGRYVGAAYSGSFRDAATYDMGTGTEALSAGRPDAFPSAAEGQFVPDSATAAFFRSEFGGT